MRGNLYIPSIDCKDLYLANNYSKNGKQIGYTLLLKNGNPNLNKYINSFDYSLDLLELRRVAFKKYSKRNPLSFIEKGKEYSKKVINVTFKYAVKEFNKVAKDTYIRNGYRLSDLDLTTGYALDDNRNLIGIKINQNFKVGIDEDVNLEYFRCVYNQENLTYTYHIIKNIPTVVSARDLREWAYKYGFYCDGVHYCRFKRSSGSARVGKCLFIDDVLYSDMHKAELCGLDIENGDELDIAAFEAYISLPTSSIIDKISIWPQNILLIDDAESIFTDSAICTDTEDIKNGEKIETWLKTEEQEMSVCNSIWDGQSLIDESLLEEKYSDKGMLLLRNKFFKSCCFNTKIQKFFEDNGITEISQLNGITTAYDIKDIKLITTPSSIKYLKFGKDREEMFKKWLDNIYLSFGVVKYDKDTHYFDGKMVQAHYQLINTLQLSREDVKSLVQYSLNYISMLNTDVDVMRYHLKYNSDIDIKPSNVMRDKNDIIYNLLNYDCGFENTKIYYEFKRNLCKSYINNIKKGHVLVDGTYATLFGNPYEMLMSSIGMFDGNTLSLQPGTVHNIRYEYGEKLLGSRSPHVTIGNILITKNVECEVIDKYFNLTDNIICVNSINENLLERLSGADFDSDSMLITNNSIMIYAAERNYHIFKVPTRNINPPKTPRKYTAEELAALDDRTSNNRIGEIVNLSQELNSLLWDIVYNSGQSVEEQYDMIKDIYYDVCQLDVLSNIEIDKAKKEYTINSAKEINKLRNKYSQILTASDGRKIMPAFLGFIADTKNYRNDAKKDYKIYDTSMDYLYEAVKNVRAKKSNGSNFTSFSYLFKPKDFEDSKVNKVQLKKIIEMATNTTNYIKSINKDYYDNWELRFFLINKAREDYLFELNKLNINQYTMYRLLQRLEKDENSNIKNFLFYMLFNYKNTTLIQILEGFNKKQYYIEPDDDGDINIYGINFIKKFTN